MTETAASENFALKDDLIDQDIADTSALDRVIAKAPAKDAPKIEIVKDERFRVRQDRSRDALLTDFGKRTLYVKALVHARDTCPLKRRRRARPANLLFPECG